MPFFILSVLGMYLIPLRSSSISFSKSSLFLAYMPGDSLWSKVITFVWLWPLADNYTSCSIANLILVIATLHLELSTITWALQCSWGSKVSFSKTVSNFETP